MVAGNQARIPSSILKGVRTLTSNIVIEMGYAADLHREVLITLQQGVVLFVFILLINISFSIIKGKEQAMKHLGSKILKGTVITCKLFDIWCITVFDCVHIDKGFA